MTAGMSGCLLLCAWVMWGQVTGWTKESRIAAFDTRVECEAHKPIEAAARKRANAGPATLTCWPVGVDPNR